MLTTPILLITFNRPQHTRRVLEAILAANPHDLYVFQDGAREGNLADVQKCQEVRDVINELVSQHQTRDTKHRTPLTLHTNYSKVNLGCGPGPMTGIDWFFQNIEQGIIMEDDCLPHPDFFGYCEELLKRYKDNPKVMFINSTLYHNRWHCDGSYGFSHYMVTGAWAAWRETWKGFDLDLKDWNAWRFRRQVNRLTGSRTEADWWYWKVKEIQQDHSKKSYWDYQMQTHLFRQGALTIHPCRNLISNIGFDEAGTHTLSNDGRGDKVVFPIMPLEHPNKIEVKDNALDIKCFGKTSPRSLCNDLISFMYQSLLHTNRVGHKLLNIYKSIKSGK